VATNKPRVTVTLDPEHYAVLADMAKVTGGTVSSIISEMVGEAAPTFRRVVSLLREAEAAKSGVGERVRELATEAELQLLPLASDALRVFESFENGVRGATSKGLKEGGGEAGAAK